MRKPITMYDILKMKAVLEKQQGPTAKIEIVNNEGVLEPIEKFIDRLKYHKIQRIEPNDK